MKKKEIIGGIIIYLIGLVFIIGMFISADNYNKNYNKDNIRIFKKQNRLYDDKKCGKNNFERLFK